jgi:anti-sigma B factor antagonist
MNVTTAALGPAMILGLDGRLTVEADTHELHELVSTATAGGTRKVVLDMGAVPYLDCSGIGQLVLLHERVRQAGGTLALVNLGPRQMHALRVVRLLEVLRVFETWDEAWRWCVGIRGNSELVVGALAASDADRSRPRQGLLLTVC